MVRSPVTGPNHYPFGPRRRGGQVDAVVDLTDRPAVGQEADASARSVLGSLLRGMEERTDLIVSETLAQAAQLEGYRDLSQAQVQRVHRMIAASIAIVLRRIGEPDGVREGEEVSGPDGEFYRMLGASRAWSGVPLDSLQEAFDICYERANAHLTQVAQQYGEVGADAVGAFARRLAKLYTKVWATIEKGYAEARTGNRKPDDSQRRELVSSVLDGMVGPQGLEVAAAGSPVTAGPAILLVAVARTPRDGLGEAVTALLAAFPNALEGVERQEPVVHVPVLVPVRADGDGLERRPRLRELAHEFGVTLVDTDPADLDGLGAAYRPVRRHLDLAMLAGGPSGVVSVGRLMRYAAVRASCPEEARWIVDRMTGPLVAASSSCWDRLATVYAVHDAEGDLQAAAEELGRARRTVRHHLSVIGGLLDVDLGKGRIPVDVDLALLLRRIHAIEPGSDDAASPQSHE